MQPSFTTCLFKPSHVSVWFCARSHRFWSSERRQTIFKNYKICQVVRIIVEKLESYVAKGGRRCYFQLES